MKRTRRGGQTLIIALLVLGVLLILGFVFLGLISRNITTGARAQQRSVANDLAEAGIRYVHGQLLTSSLAADWHVQPTVNLSTLDPDYQYLKPGGPDGLGSFGRVEFDAGRAIVRARYGPSDANIFSANPAGPLRIPGRAKNYIIIESIGKPGKVNPNDPTTANDFRGERERTQSRKLIAFASIGITEQAFFVTNKFNVSRAIEIGAPNELGLKYSDLVGAASPLPDVKIPVQFGDNQLLPNLTGGISLTPVPYGASMYFNGDVVVHGDVTAFTNRYLGDAINVAGSIVGADNANAVLRINGADVNGAGNWVPFTGTLTNTGTTSLDSHSPQFSTVAGTVKDGVSGADSIGFTRGMRRKEPPSFLNVDPVTHESVYRQMSRDSGAVGQAGNTGAFGYGQSVYVNNASDRQNRTDEQGREVAETTESLTFDWLNPNNGQAGSGWQGAFYVPRGAYLQLIPDGFLILRDSRGPANERTWRNPDGTDTTNPTIRYRVGKGTNGQIYILNNVTNAGIINQANLTPANYDQGQPFTGVLYFEGNVRVRGTIPTDTQLTVVSGGTIYIEGSITKGIVENQVSTPGLATSTGNRLNRSSLSMLMLAAKDFVAINTSQFFGPAPTQAIEEVNDLPSVLEYNPVRMRRAATPGFPSSYNFRTELLLDPNNGNPANPSTWKPFSSTYQEFGSTNFIDPGLMVTHTMDDGPASNSFLSLDVNFGVSAAARQDWQYLFDLNRTPSIATNVFDPFQKNNASDYAPYATPGVVEPGYGLAQQDRGKIYGIGAESWQRYSKFETTFFPIAESGGFGAAYAGFPAIPIRQEHGTYHLLAQETNEFNWRFNDIIADPSNDYLIARAAMVPNDVRIEASIYAEEGSFFVIPSPWFNPNANDRRDSYLARVSAIGAGPAQVERYENFGAGPMTPFYGEPVDVKVTIVGAVSQNMTAPMSQQAEWLKKWGWIPRFIGDARDPSTGNNRMIPQQHVPAGFDLTTDLYVPNLVITYDPALGSGRAWDPGNPSPFSPANPSVRADSLGRMLPPMPRLPVSPTLAYFGEENQ